MSSDLTVLYRVPGPRLCCCTRLYDHSWHHRTLCSQAQPPAQRSFVPWIKWPKWEQRVFRCLKVVKLVSVCFLETWGNPNGYCTNWGGWGSEKRPFKLDAWPRTRRRQNCKRPWRVRRHGHLEDLFLMKRSLHISQCRVLFECVEAPWQVLEVLNSNGKKVEAVSAGRHGSKTSWFQEVWQYFWTSALAFFFPFLGNFCQTSVISLDRCEMMAFRRSRQQAVAAGTAGWLGCWCEM